jgi:hypothetical protein
MQVENADAASLAVAVAPRETRFDGKAWAGSLAASEKVAVHHVGAAVCSGHDDESGKSRSFWTRAAKRSEITAVPAVMAAAITGMQLARPRVGASAVFVTGSKAGGDAASLDNAGAGNGPKKGVMTYDACMGGYQAVRKCAVAIMAGS